jgi:hypothetical protein
MTGTDADSSFPLKTIDAEGQAPKSRLSDANIAQQIYWNTHQANLGRNNYGAYLQGICDGNPPYRQSSLRTGGQGWRANFSTRESKSRKDAAKTPYYDLFSSGPTYASVNTSVRDRISASDASGVITEEFDRMMKSWIGFDMNVWTMLDCFVGFGRGWLFWPRAEDWHFKRIPWWKVRFPDGADVDPEEWDMFTIQHNYAPVNLNKYIREPEVAGAGGWNVKRVREAIRNATPYDPQSTQDMMAVQQMIADQDIQIMYRSNTVQAASVFVKEFDGTWSRMIVETGKTSNTDVELGADDWLYYKRGVAQSVHELIAPFIFEVETGSINGLGGILELITDQVKIKNRLRCEEVNNAFLRSTVLLQASNASSRVKSGMITVGGGVTLIPEGMSIQQSSVIGDIQSAEFLDQAMTRELDVNTGVFRPQQEKPAGNPEPLGTTQLRYAQASVLTNSAVNRFQQQMDWFLSEVYRRAIIDHSDSKQPALKAAREFQKRCKDRGVTREQLEKTVVKAVRVVGNGSPAMRSQLTAELGSVAPQFGQRGRLNWLKDFVAARGGQTKVERYLPVEDEQDIATQQDREALQENAVVKIGSPVVVVENDDHIVHLRRHFEAAFAALEAAQQGAPPDEAASFIQGILPHIAEHIGLVTDSNAQKEAVQLYKQLDGDFKKLVAAIEQNKPDPEQQQQVLTDIQLKQMDTQARIEDRNMKTQASLQDKERKTQQSLAINALKTRQGMELADATTAAKIRRENATAMADIMRNGHRTEDK